VLIRVGYISFCRNMKAVIKVLLYVGLSALGLLVVSVLAFWGWMRWEYRLPSEQTAREHFERHRVDYVRFASLLQQDPGAKVINPNGDVDAYTDRARHVPEYHDLIRKIGAKSVMVRGDGSIEFEVWGFGCAPCHDSFMGLRYFRVDGPPHGFSGWPPKLVASLDDKTLPKERGVVADGLYVLPLDREWSIYRLEID
jgi:hypothetical protein